MNCQKLLHKQICIVCIRMNVSWYFSRATGEFSTKRDNEDMPMDNDAFLKINIHCRYLTESFIIVKR